MLEEPTRTTINDLLLLWALVGTVGTIVFSGWNFCFERPRRKKAEAEIAQIRARARGPLLVASELHYLRPRQGLPSNFPNRQGAKIRARQIIGRSDGSIPQVTHLPTAEGHHDVFTQEAAPDSLEKGAPINLYLANTGANVVDVQARTEAFYLFKTASARVLGHGPASCWLEYSYDPAKKRTPVRFTITYQSEGYRDTQTYQFLHGVNSIERVEEQ